MHSRQYLHSEDFSFHRDGRASSVGQVFGRGWSPADRIVIVAPDPARDLARVAGAVLAWTCLFYARPEARAQDFFDYPLHYVVGGETGAAPRLLGPAADAAWSRAWYRLDVWPASHHAVAEPEPNALLAALTMLEPNVVLWPARLARPAEPALPAGPDPATARALLLARLREAWLYGDELADDAADWRLEYGGGAATLAREACGRLAEDVAIDRTENRVVQIAPNAFLS